MMHHYVVMLEMIKPYPSSNLFYIKLEPVLYYFTIDAHNKYNSTFFIHDILNKRNKAYTERILSPVKGNTIIPLSIFTQ